MELSTSGKEGTLIPEGTHLANCISIIDMGTQAGRDNKKGEPTEYRALNFGFECANEEDEEGNKLTGYRQYSASLTPKSHLGKAVVAWLGRRFEKDETFEIGTLAGKACQITVTHKEVEGNTYANITGITGVPKGVKVPKPDATVQTLFLEKDEFDQDTFDGLPDWLQDKIKTTKEYKALFGGKTTSKPAPGKAPAKKGKDVPF